MFSVNQMFRSGPTVIIRGPLLGRGKLNSTMVPSGVMRPILLPKNSQNQRHPSGPATMS
jgi:hypothetical protein